MRIVSLCPSLTELVFDLGRGEDLVGITTWCVHPADRVGPIEKVGGTKDPDVGRVLQLAPDVVLLNEEENRVEDADRLREAGVSCHASFPRSVADTAAMVRSIASRLDRPEQGEAIATEIEARAARVARATRTKAPVSWAYLIWRKPWMSVNHDTFAHALLELAGGQNVFSDRRERYPVVTLEELASAAPQCVLLCTEPYAFDESHVNELSRLTGIPSGLIRIADGEYLSWHGSRTPDGIDYVERLLDQARTSS